MTSCQRGGSQSGGDAGSRQGDLRRRQPSCDCICRRQPRSRGGEYLHQQRHSILCRHHGLDKRLDRERPSCGTRNAKSAGSIIGVKSEIASTRSNGTYDVCRGLHRVLKLRDLSSTASPSSRRSFRYRSTAWRSSSRAAIMGRLLAELEESGALENRSSCSLATTASFSVRLAH
jgi:hypothetical protein